MTIPFIPIRCQAVLACPGIRPIGCGEVLRRIIGKTVMSIAGGDAKVICGADQVCAGLEAGIEAAVHAMNDLFSEHAGLGWGVLLVDAANAFNALNRKVALWQARFLWLQGKVRSAVPWVTEREKGGVLAQDDMVSSKDSHGNCSLCSVREVLKQEHPASRKPGIEAMHNYDFPPPLMPGLDVTAEHVESTARKLQGGAGPGGSNAEAWQDWLLRFGEHSAKLREAVALLTRRMSNDIVPWEQWRA